MNLCLIRPATLTTADGTTEDAAPPLGVAYLAAAARRAGHRVSVIDGLGEALDRFVPVPGIPTALRHGLADAEVVARIPDDAEVIGLSAMFSLEWPCTRDLAERIRRRFPRALLIAGGEHVTAIPEYVMADCPALDACVLGEGEATLVDLLEVAAGDGDLGRVGGLCLRRADGAARATGERPRIRELSELPRPAWDLVPIDAYLDSGVMTGLDLGRSMPIMASRGCPYRCTFCSNPAMWGTLWRAREPGDVLDEMLDYHRRYGVTNFDFYDLTAIVKRAWILEFCELVLESGVELTWQLPSGTRSEALDAEVTDLLHRAGCRCITYAPESGSEVTLERIEKRIDKDRMIASMRSAVANGMSIKANIIMGFPDETLPRALATVAFVLRMAWTGIHDVACFPFSPYPGSALFDQLRLRGEIELDDDYFYGLCQYTDPRYTRSYSEHLPRPLLRLLCLAGMGLFYLASFLLRPARLVRLVRSVASETPTSKLAAALIRVLRKRRQLEAA